MRIQRLYLDCLDMLATGVNMSKAWQLQDAKNKFSEVVDKALEKGPQEITRHGKKTAVLLSVQDYRKLKREKGNLAEFFQSAPLSGIVETRSKDYPRSVGL